MSALDHCCADVVTSVEDLPPGVRPETPYIFQYLQQVAPTAILKVQHVPDSGDNVYLVTNDGVFEITNTDERGIKPDSMTIRELVDFEKLQDFVSAQMRKVVAA